MPRLAEPKSHLIFANAKPGEKDALIPDGKGLGLLIRSQKNGGAKLWVFRYRFDGKEKKIAIKGGYPAVSVKAARDEAERFRNMLDRGEDPAAVRKAAFQDAVRQEVEARAEAVKNAKTFEVVARDWHAKAAEHLAPSNARETLRRLEKDVFPSMGSKPISEIKAPDVLAPLRRVEQRGARESAHRILSVCSQIFRYAVSCGLIESDPARDLRGALARPTEGHFAALTEPQEVARFLHAVDAYDGTMVVKAAIKFGVLTFVRPGNLREARWEEFFDLEIPGRAEWRIPGTKMKVKTKRPFVVPLAPQHLRLLEQLRPLTGHSPLVFLSNSSSTNPISNMTVLAAIRRMGFNSDEMTGHGVRAMARTMCHQELGFAPEVIEEQLAHGKSGPLRGAYDRTTFMPQRRQLMVGWADYLDKLFGGDFVPKTDLFGVELSRPVVSLAQRP